MYSICLMNVSTYEYNLIYDAIFYSAVITILIKY